MSEALHEQVFQYAANDDELDIHGIGRAIARRKRLVIGSTLFAFLAAAIYVTVVAPRYTGEAQVLVENQENYFTLPDSAANEVTPAPDAEAVTSQIQLISSRDLARDAIKALGLKRLPEFDPGTGAVGPLTRILILLGIHRAPTANSVEDRILHSYYARLAVSEVAKSRVLTIDFWSKDPQLAAKAANTIADLYISLQADAKRNRARVAAESLAAQIAELKTKVTEAENKAATFRASADLFVGGGNTTLLTQQLADINNQLSMARSAEADAQAKAHLIRDMLRRGRLNEIADVADNNLVRQISAQRIDLRAQLALESRTYLPGHPRIKALDAKLADLESALRTAARQTAQALENNAKIAAARVANLQATLDQQKKTVGDSSADEAKMQELDGDARVLKSQLDAAIARYQEALARGNASSTPGDARVISRAVVPMQPTFPKKLPLTIFATLAGLVLSVVWIVSGELLSGRAFVPSEDEAEPLVSDFAPDTVAGPSPDYGVTKTRPAATSVVPSTGMKQNGSAAIKTILARFDEEALGDFAIRILVASSSSGVSCSATALSLARALARDRRVILVELEGAGVAGTVPGLSELIAGHASFAEVINRDRGSRLHLITTGRCSVDPSADLDLALEALSQTYDYVVLATPPVNTAPTARVLAPGADFVMLVCQGDATDRETHETLVRCGAKEIFLVTPEAEMPEDAKTAA